MHTIARFTITSTLFLLLACENGTQVSSIPHELEKDAQQLITELKEKRWSAAAKLCLVDEYARQRFSLSSSDDEKVILDTIADTFQQLYENLPPGEIYGMDIDPNKKGDANFARVVYFHGDLDAFSMRKVGNRWRYSYE